MKNSLLRGLSIFVLGFGLVALSACAEPNEVDEPAEPVEEEVLTEEPMMEEPMMEDTTTMADSLMEEPMEEGAVE